MGTRLQTQTHGAKGNDTAEKGASAALFDM